MAVASDRSRACPSDIMRAGGLSLEEIAEREGVSRQRVDAILKRALAKLKAELERRGIKATDDLTP